MRSSACPPGQAMLRHETPDVPSRSAYKTTKLDCIEAFAVKSSEPQPSRDARERVQPTAVANERPEDCNGNRDNARHRAHGMPAPEQLKSHCHKNHRNLRGQCSRACCCARVQSSKFTALSEPVQMQPPNALRPCNQPARKKLAVELSELKRYRASDEGSSR